MSDTEVLVDRADGVMTITLNRPQAKNAVNLALAEGVAAAIHELEENDELRVGIITGAGGTFCAGMDLKAFVKGENPVIEGYGFAGLCSYIAKKPMIAAVEGYALAGGFEVAISCDLIVASEAARFGIPEVKRGLAAAAGGLVRLPKQISPRIAMELALTGDFITAERAYEIGLINQVVAEGGALAAARSLADRIAANGPLAVAASKYLVARAQDWSNDEMFDRQQAVVLPVIQSEDAIEGSVAFAEKRAPQWKGR
jgi:enoyl-CoA hydratase